MDTREAFVLLFSVVATAAVMISALVVIPACSASVFRHWLWDLHDEVVEAAQDGKVDADEDLHDFLHRVHVLIANANRFRMLDVLLTYVAARSVHGRAEPMPTLGETLPPQILAWESRLMSRANRQLVFGSPSGWILTLPLMIAAIVWAIVRTMQNYRPTRLAVQDRIIRLEVGQVPDVLSALVPANDRHGESDMRHPCLV